MVLKNKKGMELAFNTIIKLILMVIVLILVIFFFTSEYGLGIDSLFNIGDSAIDNARVP